MKKFKLWFKKIGLTSLGYLALFVVAVFFNKNFFAGAFLGIFTYVNWNTIKKLWKEKVSEEVEELVKKVKEKI